MQNYFKITFCEMKYHWFASNLLLNLGKMLYNPWGTMIVLFCNRVAPTSFNVLVLSEYN